MHIWHLCLSIVAVGVAWSHRRACRKMLYRQLAELYSLAQLVRVRVMGHLYSALLWDELIGRDAQVWPMVARGSHSFTCHPLTNHTWLLPSRRASPPYGWYSFHLPTEGWPGWVDLGDWLYTEIDFPALGVEPRTRSPIPVLTGPGVD